MSDGRIRELVGSNPSDPRTEIVRLRMRLTTHEQERARYEARLTNLNAQFDGVQSALKVTTTARAKLQETIDNTVDRSGQLSVAENMAKLLEDEAKILRSRISTEVAERVNAQTELSQALLDLKHTKKKVDSLEQDLAVASARNGGGYDGAGPITSSLGSASSSSYGTTSSAVTSSIGGIEYFNPQSYGQSYNKGYGASYGDGFSSSMSEIDSMRDIKLTEDRAKSAEKREKLLIEKLHKIEAEAAGLRTHGEKSGYIGIDVHTRLIDMADERARDSDRKTRELETEIISLRNRARVGRGLQYLEGPDPLVSSLLSKLNQCIIGAGRILPESAGAILKDADYAEQAARDERAWKARMAEQERRREDAEAALANAVDQEVQRRADLGVAVTGVPTMQVHDAAQPPSMEPSERSVEVPVSDDQPKKAPPPTTPKPTKKGSVQDKVNSLAAGEGSAQSNAVKSDYKPVASPVPKRLNTALMSKIAGSIPVPTAVGATALDMMKAARRQRATTTDTVDDEDWDRDEGAHIPEASAAAAASHASDETVAAESDDVDPSDSIVGEVSKAPSLTGQFSRPQIQRGKRLPSRKKSKSAMSPAVPESPSLDDASPEPAPPPVAAVTAAAAAVPPPNRHLADDEDDDEDDEDWGDDDEPVAPPSKAALMQRMAKLAGASRPGAMPIPAAVPPPQQADDESEESDIASPAPSPPRVSKPAPTPSPAVKKKPPPPAVAKKTPKVAPKVSKKSPKPLAKKKAEAKPVAPAVAEEKLVAPTKVPAPTQLFAVADADDLFAAAKSTASTKAKGKKKGTSLFNLSDDSDDDWLN